MIDTLTIFDKLKEVMDEHTAKKLAEVLGMVYHDLQNTVTKTEFGELKDIVKDLGEAQKRTESRVEELAEAQKRTESRMEKLAEAQEQLAKAQERTEVKLGELAEAQRRTIEELRDTRKQVGGLATTVGYRLEDEAYKGLPKLLKRDFGIVVKDRLTRQYLTDNKDNDIEVNIFGEASQNGKKLVIVGEGKSQLSKNDINHFIRRKLNRLMGVYENLFPVLVTYMISSRDVEKYANEKGITLYYSYDL